LLRELQDRSAERLTLHERDPFDEITVPVSRDVKISGRVYQLDGSAASGIRVTQQRHGAPVDPRDAATTPDGRFEFRAVGGLEVIVAAVADNRWVAPLRRIPLKGESIENVDFQLSEGTVVRGTVTEGPDHRALAGENIEIVSEPHDTRGQTPRDATEDPYGPLTYRLHSVTDRQGRYQLRVPPGNYRLRAASLYENPKDPHHFDLEITDQKEIVRDFDLPLIPMQPLSGRVIDADGRPMANRKVAALLTEEIDHRTPPLEATTDEDGKFQLDRPIVPVYVTAVDRSHSDIDGAVVVGPDVKHVVIKMFPVVQAHGRLLDQKGNPVTEGFIVYGLKPTSYFEREIEPAGDGSYTLKHVIPGLELSLYYRENRKAKPVCLTAFTAEPGKDLDLGDTPIPNPAAALERPAK